MFKLEFKHAHHATEHKVLKMLKTKWKFKWAPKGIIRKLESHSIMNWGNVVSLNNFVKLISTVLPTIALAITWHSRHTCLFLFVHKKKKEIDFLRTLSFLNIINSQENISYIKLLWFWHQILATAKLENYSRRWNSTRLLC